MRTLYNLLGPSFWCTVCTNVNFIKIVFHLNQCQTCSSFILNVDNYVLRLPLTRRASLWWYCRSMIAKFPNIYSNTCIYNGETITFNVFDLSNLLWFYVYRGNRQTIDGKIKGSKYVVHDLLVVNNWINVSY